MEQVKTQSAKKRREMLRDSSTPDVKRMPAKKRRALASAACSSEPQQVRQGSAARGSEPQQVRQRSASGKRVAASERRKQGSAALRLERFDLADPVASELLQPLVEGSSASRVQRTSLAVAQHGGSSSSTSRLAKLGNYGDHPSNIERDLHNMQKRIQQSCSVRGVEIVQVQLTVLDVKAMKREVQGCPNVSRE